MEVSSRRLCDNLGAVVEEHTGRHVREQIAEAVLGRIIDPFGDPNLRCLIQATRALARGLRSNQPGVVVGLQRLMAQPLPRGCALG